MNKKQFDELTNEQKIRELRKKWDELAESRPDLIEAARARVAAMDPDAVKAINCLPALIDPTFAEGLTPQGKPNSPGDFEGFKCPPPAHYKIFVPARFQVSMSSLRR